MGLIAPAVVSAMEAVLDPSDSSTGERATWGCLKIDTVVVETEVELQKGPERPRTWPRA